MREAVKMLELTVADEITQSEAERNVHSEQDPPPTKKTKPGKVSHFFSDLTGAQAKRKHVSRYDVVKSEPNQYDQDPLLDLDKDPLECWKSREVQDVSGCEKVLVTTSDECKIRRSIFHGRQCTYQQKKQTPS